MELRLSKDLSIEEWIESSTRNNLPDQAIKDIMENKAKISKKAVMQEITTLDDESLLKNMKRSSIYMFYQLIETTPKTKNTLIKLFNQNKEQIVKDLDNTEPIEWLEEIEKKTPEKMIHNTKAIHSIIRLALNETESFTYRKLLLEGMPYIKKWHGAHQSAMKRKQDYLNEMLEIATSGSSEEIEKYVKSKPMKMTEKTLKPLIKNKATEQVKEMQLEFDQEVGFDMHHIQQGTKNIENIHRQKRTVQMYGEGPVQYSNKDLYIAGTVYFMSEFLNMFEDTSYVFESKTELKLYVHLAMQINALYASEPLFKRAKRSKTKDRPIPIRNNETFGQIINQYLKDEESDRISGYLSMLYTQLGKRGDLLWNTIMDKNDLDRATQLLAEWEKTFSKSTNNISANEKKRYFLNTLLITALEKQDEASKEDIKEAVIRLDEQQERKHQSEIKERDNKIDYLTTQLEQKNHALSRIEHYRKNTVKLEEKVQWLEELIAQEEQIEESTKNSTEEIDSKKIIEVLKNKETCILGGNINWQQSLREDVPEATYIEAEEVGRSLRPVERAEIIIYNSATMNHGMFYRFKNSLKRNPNKPTIIYVNSQASNMVNMYKHIGQHLNKKETNKYET